MENWRQKNGKASKQASKQKFCVLWLVVKRKVKVILGRHPRLARGSEVTISAIGFFSRSQRKAGTSLKSAFTLVELSIVLVIIGLLAGGVLLGKDLIQAAEVRAQISQLEKLETEINTFKIKYNCLSGDCTNATTFLSTYAGYTIYDGDGDGTIGSPGGIGRCNNGIPTNWQPLTEAPQVFLHIMSSGIGSYDNRPTPGTWAHNVNLPSLPHDIWGGGMVVHCLDSWSPNGGIFIPSNFEHGTNIIIGLVYINNQDYTDRLHYMFGWNTASGIPRTLKIPSMAAMSIDQKIDDGFPSSGRVGVLINCNGGVPATDYSQFVADGCNVSMAKKLWE